MKRIVIVLLALLFCACCRTSIPAESRSGGERTGLAGSYVFSSADLKITLALKPNASYYFSKEGWSGAATDETGIWTISADDVVLQPQHGSVAEPFRRLKVVRQNAGVQLLTVAAGRDKSPFGICFKREN